MASRAATDKALREIEGLRAQLKTQAQEGQHALKQSKSALDGKAKQELEAATQRHAAELERLRQEFEQQINAANDARASESAELSAKMAELEARLQAASDSAAAAAQVLRAYNL